MLAGSTATRTMKQEARNIAGARADITARISSIRRQGGDGDVNLADVWPTITRGGARRAEPELEEGWRVQVAASERVRVAPPGSVRAAPPGSVRAAPPGRVRAAPREPGPPFRMCTRSPQRRKGVTVPGLTSTIREL